MGAERHKCGLKNHFSRMCHTKVSSKRTVTKQVIHKNDEESSDEDTTNLYGDTITDTKSKQNDEWRAILILNDKSVSFKLDTGAGGVLA